MVSMNPILSIIPDFHFPLAAMINDFRKYAAHLMVTKLANSSFVASADFITFKGGEMICQNTTTCAISELIGFTIWIFARPAFQIAPCFHGLVLRLLANPLILRLWKRWRNPSTSALFSDKNRFRIKTGKNQFLSARFSRRYANFETASLPHFCLNLRNFNTYLFLSQVEMAKLIPNSNPWYQISTHFPPLIGNVCQQQPTAVVHASTRSALTRASKGGGTLKLDDWWAIYFRGSARNGPPRNCLIKSGRDIWKIGRKSPSPGEHPSTNFGAPWYTFLSSQDFSNGFSRSRFALWIAGLKLTL